MGCVCSHSNSSSISPWPLSANTAESTGSNNGQLVIDVKGCNIIDNSNGTNNNHTTGGNPAIILVAPVSPILDKDLTASNSSAHYNPHNNRSTPIINHDSTRLVAHASADTINNSNQIIGDLKDEGTNSNSAAHLIQFHHQNLINATANANSGNGSASGSFSGRHIGYTGSWRAAANNNNNNNTSSPMTPSGTAHSRDPIINRDTLSLPRNSRLQVNTAAPLLTNHNDIISPASSIFSLGFPATATNSGGIQTFTPAMTPAATNINNTVPINSYIQQAAFITPNSTLSDHSFFKHSPNLTPKEANNNTIGSISPLITPTAAAAGSNPNRTPTRNIPINSSPANRSHSPIHHRVNSGGGGGSHRRSSTGDRLNGETITVPPPPHSGRRTKSTGSRFSISRLRIGTGVSAGIGADMADLSVNEDITPIAAGNNSTVPNTIDDSGSIDYLTDELTRTPNLNHQNSTGSQYIPSPMNQHRRHGSGSNYPIPDSPMSYSTAGGDPYGNAAPFIRSVSRLAIETSSILTSYTQSGQKQINQYIIQSEIGRGSYGTVKKVLNSLDQQYYAMKILSKSLMAKRRIIGRKISNPADDHLQYIAREIAIMKKLDHPNIVKLFEVLDDESTDNLYLIMELMQGPCLKEKEKISKSNSSLSLFRKDNNENENPIDNKPAAPAIDTDTGTIVEDESESEFERLSLPTAHRYFRQIVLGLEYIHRNQILHRDLKPENLLLDNFGTVKISDFGASTFFSGVDDTQSTSAGTAAFSCPEICRGSKSYSGQSADVWSLGVCLFVFLTGKLPFNADSVHLMYERIVSQQLKFPNNIRLSTELQNLITGMLMKDPNERLTLQQVKQHQWSQHTPANTAMNSTYTSAAGTNGAILLTPDSNLISVSDSEFQSSLAPRGSIQVSADEINAAVGIVSRVVLWLKHRGKVRQKVADKRQREQIDLF